MQIKFLNLNLWEGGKLKDNILNFLKRERPDILSLQEVWQCPSKIEHIEIEYLVKLLNTPYLVTKKEHQRVYSVFSPTFATRKYGEKIIWGNAILSKFPIEENHTKFFVDSYLDNYISKIKGDFSDAPKNYLYVKIRVKDKTLDVFNIHGVWGFDGEDNPERLQMSESIINGVKNKSHVILSGDFNTKPHTESMRNIEKYLTNVFKDELKTSFNMKRKNPPGGYANSVVDFVFVSPDIKVVSHLCPLVDVSDHLPQICEFEV